MSLAFRLVLRCELHAPSPPNPAKGLGGMEIADQVLKKYGTVGILIGGLAKLAWSGVTDSDHFKSRKDVDVLVLSKDCNHHPKQWENGVDWWVRHKSTELPTNGNDVGIIWKTALKKGVVLPAGLYFCTKEQISSCMRHERIKLGQYFYTENVKLDKLALDNFPVIPPDAINVKWGQSYDDVAEYCGVDYEN